MGKSSGTSPGIVNFFLRFGKLYFAKRHAPRENFYRWCNLGRFGVYLDQIFYFKKILKVPFFIYIFFKLPFFT